ncbi:hypothetical protein ACFLXW_00465 [Candidatus Dependentiae bacterium]
MNYKQSMALLLLAVSLGCHAGVKKRLKKFFPCIFASQAVSESDNSSDKSEFVSSGESELVSSDESELVCHSERGPLSERDWNPELFRRTGILPEDIAKNPTHPDKAAYERRILEAME